jgi:hypothetical protein
MRIRIVRAPKPTCIDGVRLEQFEPGQQYEVGTTLGALLLCEGWAEPLDDQSPALIIPLNQVATTSGTSEPVPQNLVRDLARPHYEGRAIAMDRSRRRARRRR